MHQIAQPVSVSNPRPAQKEKVTVAARGMDRRTPQVIVAGRGREHSGLLSRGGQRIGSN